MEVPSKLVEKLNKPRVMVVVTVQVKSGIVLAGFSHF